MLKQGNSNPNVTSMNLLKTLAGEVPLARNKGVDIDVFDKPYAQGFKDFEDDIIEKLEEYEPRAEITSVGQNEDGEIIIDMINISNEEMEEKENG